MGRLGSFVVALVGVAVLAPGASAQGPEPGITQTLPYLDVVHEGRKVRIQRRAAGAAGPNGSGPAGSGACPPSCIQPLRAAPGVETVGELELLAFMQAEISTGRGLLVDARLPQRYRQETLPTAMNVPFSVIKADNPHMGRILVALGARPGGSGWDFSGARELVVFCAGAFSNEASTSVSTLLAIGYPAGKLRYYRGGLQAWRQSGLTTVVPLAAP